MNGFLNTSRSLSGLLLAGTVVFHVSHLPAQNPSASSGSPVGQRSEGQAIAIAVMDFDGFGISQTEAIALSNRLRNELFKLGTFEVVDRGMMENILREQDFQMAGCTSNECLVEVGQLLGAQQMVGGSISKVGNTYSVSARMVDVMTGKLIGVSDYDLRGEIDDMLTGGMREVALMLSGDYAGAQSVAAQQAFQPGPPVAGRTEAAAQQGQPGILARATPQKPRRWQSRVGWLNESNHMYYITWSLAYDLPYQLNLQGIEFQSVVSGGYLDRRGSDYRAEVLYGILEVHKKWSHGWSAGNLGASVYSGIGIRSGYSNYSWHTGQRYDDSLSWIFVAGAQAKGTLSTLPALVADVHIVTSPGIDTWIIVSYGLQGRFLTAAIFGFIGWFGTARLQPSFID